MDFTHRHARPGLWSRLTPTALVSLLLLTLAASPAAAGSGIDGVQVPLDSPTSHSQDIRWISMEPVSGALPAGAASVRYSFPAQVTATDVDPASLQVAASAGGDLCDTTTDGLRMDGWELVVDPATLLASRVGQCATDPWFKIWLRGSGSFDSLDMVVELHLSPGGATGDVRVVLPAHLTGDGHTYTTAPAHAAPGVVLDVRAEPTFFDVYAGRPGVYLVDASGAALADLSDAARVGGDTASRLGITLPTDLPTAAVGVKVVVVGFMFGDKTVTIPFTAPVDGTVEAYVMSVYEDLFNRSAEPGGLAAWSAALRDGADYGRVADAITYSDENRQGMIAAAYRTYLDRGPDAEGLRSWLTAMQASLHIEKMQAGFISSPEYYSLSGGNDRGWITRLYEKVLDRQPASSEIDLWRRQLDSGSSRYDVAIGFLYSTEHLTAVVDGYYLDLLHRHIDPSGSANWVRLIQSGYRDEQIIAGIVASQEYRANVPRP